MDVTHEYVVRIERQERGRPLTAKTLILAGVSSDEPDRFAATVTGLAGMLTERGVEGTVDFIERNRAIEAARQLLGAT